MTDHDPNAERDEQVKSLKVAMTEANSAIAAIDSTLTMFLSQIVHPPPLGQQDLELASILLFSQGTVERRVDIVRRVLTLRLAGWLKCKPHEYPRKVADFIIKAFNLAADIAKRDTWIRNTSAHGTIFMGKPGDEPRLIPSPFDFDGVQRFHEKRGGKGPPDFVPKNGFTAAELQNFAAESKKGHMPIIVIGEAVAAIFAKDATSLEAKLVALGRDLKLQPPLQAQPPRGKRERRKKG
jgi:hypothetical protein